ncbi:hypothetical protein [Paenibacillus sp. 276b]|uniref:hypothetical protein n=1 Tax=Paenibacillus sp. 276b TaxID=1566277 RepID=UPI0008989029|nr:hypothetical protein [Paenibacillus sp. 276b]SEB27646.1 hypothetical protein SAMN03159332_6323 [Paenibacillus sp. 276b]
MSILDDMRKKITEMESTIEEYKVISSKLPTEINYVVQSLLNHELNDLRFRLERFTFLKSEKQCTQCNNWIKENEDPTILNFQYKTTKPVHMTLCNNCMSSMDKVMVTNEAEPKWGLRVGTIKQDRQLGKLKEFEDLGLVKLSGRYIKIHEIVMKTYYEPKLREKQLKENNRKDTSKNKK